MQLLTKGFLIIKDAKVLDATPHSDFTSALVAWRKRI
jgi:hypothetical protein